MVWESSCEYVDELVVIKKVNNLTISNLFVTYEGKTEKTSMCIIQRYCVRVCAHTGFLIISLSRRGGGGGR